MAIEAQLLEAQTALHQLMTGTSAVRITKRNGESVEFKPADETKLRNYIDQLQAELGVTVTRRRRPGRAY